MTSTVARRAMRTALERSAASASGLVVAGIFYLMVTSVLSGVWRVAAQANGGSLVGYRAAALVWYIAASEAVTIALKQRMIEEIGDDIGSGRFVAELLRPRSSLLVRVASEIGETIPRLGVCAAFGVAFSWTIAGAPPSAAALALAAPSLLLAVTINLLAQHAFAAIAFWVLDAKGAWFLYQKLVFVLGGMLIPLEVLPEPLQTVAKLLPFSTMAYAPARLASGHVEPRLLVVQLGWLVVGIVLARKMFAAGERHLIGAGS